MSRAWLILLHSFLVLVLVHCSNQLRLPSVQSSGREGCAMSVIDERKVKTQIILCSADYMSRTLLRPIYTSRLGPPKACFRSDLLRRGLVDSLHIVRTWDVRSPMFETSIAIQVWTLAPFAFDWVIEVPYCFIVCIAICMSLSLNTAVYFWTRDIQLACRE